MRGLIISGGAIDDAFACKIMKNGGYDIVIAADSGMEFLYRHHLTPDIIVGDMDSAAGEVLSHFQQQEQIEFCTLNPEKDDTDTEYAVREAVARGVQSLTILGGSGTRIDHILSNISLLGIGLEQQVSMELLDSHNRIRMIDQPITITKKQQFGKYVSLIPYTGRVTGVTLEGFRYPLVGYTMQGFNSLGVSNEIVEEEAHIRFTDGILLVIESRD